MHLAAARLGDPAAIQARVQQAEQTAREGLDEARRMIWDMGPEQLEQSHCGQVVYHRSDGKITLCPHLCQTGGFRSYCRCDCCPQDEGHPAGQVSRDSAWVDSVGPPGGGARGGDEEWQGESHR